MISLPLNKLKPGMVTAQGVYNSQGASFLSRGTAVNQQYISGLSKIGVKEIAVTSINPAFQLPPPEDVVQEQTRVNAIHHVHDTFSSMEKTGELNINALEDVASNLLKDVLDRRDFLVQLTDIRRFDQYTFAHSVNVAVLSAIIGSYLHLTQSSMHDLVMGALLNDVGKLIIPSEILNKNGSLTSNELEVVRLHPTAGHEKLTKLVHNSSNLFATIAAQHHEHLSGHGYPLHLMANNIHQFSRIVAIADVYDALTSARPYKAAYKPHIAYKIMTQCSNGQFDTPLLFRFFDNVALYPVGTVLKTKAGLAIVKESEFGHTRTPKIIVFADLQYHVLPEPFILNTHDCRPNTIEAVVEDKELIPLFFRLRVDPAFYLDQDLPEVGPSTIAQLGLA